MLQNDQTENRHDKLLALQQQGIAPYGGRFPKTQPIKAFVESYVEGAAVSTAGRLSARRGMGALLFADLRDATGKVQACVKQDRVGEAAFKQFGSFDLGDIVGVTGAFFKTNTGK